VDILSIGAKLLKSKLGGAGGDDKAVAGALSGLIGGGEGKLDLAGLVEKFKGSGMGDLANSWLGDGENAGISADQVKQAVGSDENSILDGLKDVLPQMIDKSSRGGSFLDSIGGLDGLINKFK
jgi:uncharacterized protein YidB (DUF937 family)